MQVRLRNRERRSVNDRLRGEIISLAKTYGLMSGYTSFVAVEEREESARIDAPVELRHIPLMIPQDHNQMHKGVPLRRIDRIHKTLGTSRDHTTSRVRRMTLSLGGSPSHVSSSWVGSAISGYSDHNEYTIFPDRQLQESSPLDEEFSAHFSSDIESDDIEFDDSQGGRAYAPISPMSSMSSNSSEPSSVEEAEAQLFEVLKLQQADGLFVWSDVLIEHLGEADSLDADTASPLWVTERVASLLE
jgi:hypothetical protein